MLFLSIFLTLFEIRGRTTQTPSIALLKVQGVQTRKETNFYMGKRVAYIYRATRRVKTPRSPGHTKIRVIWGRIVKPHGNSGVVRARFRTNLPPKAMGATLRVMLYPSNI